MLATYPVAVDADVLIVGHHGSKSSSRSAFVQAVSPTVSVISAGPTKYQTVVLPDDEVVDELEAAGDVLRTDVEDDKCASNAHKIGSDADGRPGGCTNIKITIAASGISGAYVDIAD